MNRESMVERLISDDIATIKQGLGEGDAEAGRGGRCVCVCVCV